MAVPPSTDLLRRVKQKYPGTWHLEVLGLYRQMIDQGYGLSDDCISLYRCIQDGLRLLAEKEKIPS